MARLVQIALSAAFLEQSLAQRSRIPAPIGIPDPNGNTYVFSGQTLSTACDPTDFLSMAGGLSTDNCANWIERTEMNPPLSPPCPPGTDPLGTKAEFCSGAVVDTTYTIIGGIAGPDICCTKLPPSPPAGINKDPHLFYPHGGRADFRGKDGQLYSFFSSPDLAVNVRTEDAEFMLHGGKLTVEGSFITEMHLVARVGTCPPGYPVERCIGAKHKFANVSFWGSELTAQNWGWAMINGTCGGHPFRLSKHGTKSCEDLSVSVKSSSATFEVGNWTFTVHANHVYDRISGPEHRLDLSVKPNGDAPARSLPHGILGQGYSSTIARDGNRDAYPQQGHFRTSAMAEGAIEGSAAMYEVALPFETRFAFSRFDAPLETSVNPLLLTTSEATAIDVAGEAEDDAAA